MEDNKCEKRECPCLRYRENEEKKDECVHCEHSIGFHVFSIININTNEHPFGRCNSNCGCQRYREGIPLKCIYCTHPESYHHRWDNQTISIAMPSPTVSVRMTPLSSTGNIVRAGRPIADTIIIRHLICFDKVSSNRIPKKGTSLWINLKNRNLIREDIKISRTTPEELYNNIFDLFSEELRGQKWILYSGSSGQPSRVTEKLSFNLIKSNITKAKRKLYIGPSERDIISPSTDDVNLLLQDNLDNSVDAEDANMEIINLPRQSSSDPEVNDFFNGFDNIEIYNFINQLATHSLQHNGNS